MDTTLFIGLNDNRPLECAPSQLGNRWHRKVLEESPGSIEQSAR